jgi:peptidoglycan/xylan/chitin deacetylase (PgdA/CDA1 family)
LGDDDARGEIVRDKHALEAIVGQQIRVFAYPNGRPGFDYSASTTRVVREAGYAAGVSTSPGVALATTDPFQLPRFTPWDRTESRFVMRLVRNMFGRPVLA